MMERKIGFLLLLAMLLGTMPTANAAWENPLQKYNLYDDVNGGNSNQNNSRERVMDTYNSNSLRPSQRSRTTTTTTNYTSTDNNNVTANSTPSSLPVYEIQEEASEPTRNETLRASSKKVYSDQSSQPAWEIGPSFYPNPSFESIKEKYHRSDFAGCMQECTSYVRLHPHDTLGYYYLAMCYTKTHDEDNAIRAYEKVISLNANPMIVKYATNGRNCILNNDTEQCYQNVNEPEYIYPYKNIANSIDLTPIDPETLVNRNLAQVQAKLTQEQAKEENNTDTDNQGNEDKKEITLPFGKQDDDLDKFINAPYGNGLSPELNKEYKQTQLKRFQETINKEDDTSQDSKNYRNIDDIKKFDKNKTDSEQIKLAYDNSDNPLKDLENNPEYIQQKKEFDELNMLLGNDKSSKTNDIADLIPYMNESNAKNISPEVIQTMMMQSMMGGFEL